MGRASRHRGHREPRISISVSVSVSVSVSASAGVIISISISISVRISICISVSVEDEMPVKEGEEGGKLLLEFAPTGPELPVPANSPYVALATLCQEDYGFAVGLGLGLSSGLGIGLLV